MPFELTPTKLIYGGEALGHHAGRTVLVPRVLPGERAEVEEVRTAKGVVHARPLRILQAAPRARSSHPALISAAAEAVTTNTSARNYSPQPSGKSCAKRCAGWGESTGREKSRCTPALRGTIGTRPNSRSPGSPTAESSWAFSSPSRTGFFPSMTASSFRRA